MKGYLLVFFVFFFLVGQSKAHCSSANFRISNDFENLALKDSLNRTKNEKPKRNFHIGLAFELARTSDGIPATALITFLYKKHQVELGPRFGLGNWAVGWYEKVIGGEVNYKFYPWGDEKRFSSYALFHGAYLYRGLNYSSVFASPAKEIKISTELSLGYGVKFTIARGFYIGSYVGLGMYQSKTNIIEGTLSDKKNTRGPGITVSLFIGYKF